MAPPYGPLPKSNTKPHKYPEKFLRPFRNKTIGEFWKEFSVDLRVAGYDRAIKIFSRTDGFVIILPFELDEDGVPLPADQRFSYSRFSMPTPKELFNRWFDNSIGTGRWIAFVLAPSGKKTGPFPPAGFQDQERFNATGLSDLPSDLSALRITPTDTFCAHVYAYERPKTGDPVFVPNGPFDAIDYLEKTKLPTGR